jgi:hypothetical protein
MATTEYRVCPGGQYAPFWAPSLEAAFEVLDDFDTLPVEACIEVVRDFGGHAVTHRIPYHSTEIELLGDPDEHSPD